MKEAESGVHVEDHDSDGQEHSVGGDSDDEREKEAELILEG